VRVESLQVEEEMAMSLDSTASDISVFTADVSLQTVYWVDSLSQQMWSSKLTESDHSLVCYCTSGHLINCLFL